MFTNDDEQNDTKKALERKTRSEFSGELLKYKGGNIICKFELTDVAIQYVLKVSQNITKYNIVGALEYRTASLTRLPKKHQEATQVLWYGYEEKYSAHLDWFDKQQYLQDENTCPYYLLSVGAKS